MYWLQSLILLCVMSLFRWLPLDAASALGGCLGRTIGPHLGVSKRCSRHLGYAFPDMSDHDKQKIVLSMWDNMGRVIGEYPHLKKIGAERITVRNEDIIKSALAGGMGGIFFSGHIGNWEAHVPGMLARYGITAALTYRALNNPYADKILARFRTLHGAIKAFPKTRESGKLLISELKNKNFLAILIDQKYNEGISAPFFGRPAMTNPVFIHLAQKYKCPLIPVQCRRLKGANFEITAYPPLALTDSHGQNLPAETIAAAANGILENWIRQSPEQWLWLHRRWDSAAFKSS
jgi:KDO2-lipid IV(A) lauroyltransferase